MTFERLDQSLLYIAAIFTRMQVDFFCADLFIVKVTGYTYVYNFPERIEALVNLSFSIRSLMPLPAAV